MVLGNHVFLYLTAGFFEKNCLPPKMWKMGKKEGFFLNVSEILVINFFWIWSIIKVYFICCILAHIPFLEKIWFLRYRPICSQPIRLQDFKINYISRTNWQKAWIFVCWYRFMTWKLELIKKYWGVCGQKWCSHSVLRALKFAVCRGGMNGINCFLVCWYKFRKAKSYFNNFGVIVAQNVSCLSGLGSLKFAVSQESVDKMSWFFACWYKFRKAESYFNNYWLGMIKNGLGFRNHGTLKSRVSHIPLMSYLKQNNGDELNRLIE